MQCTLPTRAWTPNWVKERYPCEKFRKDFAQMHSYEKGSKYYKRPEDAELPLKFFKNLFISAHLTELRKREKKREVKTPSRSCSINACIIGGVWRCVLTSSVFSSLTSGLVRHKTVGPDPVLQLCGHNSRQLRSVLNVKYRQQNGNPDHRVSDGALCLSIWLWLSVSVRFFLSLSLCLSLFVCLSNF